MELEVLLIVIIHQAYKPVGRRGHGQIIITAVNTPKTLAGGNLGDAIILIQMDGSLRIIVVLNILKCTM